MTEMQSSKSPFRASCITMSSPDPAWSIELLIGVNGRLARDWPAHNPQPQPGHFRDPIKQPARRAKRWRRAAGCRKWRGRAGSRLVWTNRDVLTHVEERQALCPGNTSAHSEITLPKTGLSQGPLAPCCERSWGWIKTNEDRPDCKERYQPERGVGRAAWQVLCAFALSHYRVWAMTAIPYIPPHVREHQRFLTCSWNNLTMEARQAVPIPLFRWESSILEGNRIRHIAPIFMQFSLCC